MIRCLVTSVWGVHEAVAASDDCVRLMQTAFAHKTGIRWGARASVVEQDLQLWQGSIVVGGP